MFRRCNIDFFFDFKEMKFTQVTFLSNQWAQFMESTTL